MIKKVKKKVVRKNINKDDDLKLLLESNQMMLDDLNTYLEEREK